MIKTKKNEEEGKKHVVLLVLATTVDILVVARLKGEFNYLKIGSPSASRFSSSTGHFTQVVWKETKELGVGISLTKGQKSVYVVAQYFLSGNILDQFELNVQQRK